MWSSVSLGLDDSAIEAARTLSTAPLACTAAGCVLAGVSAGPPSAGARGR